MYLLQKDAAKKLIRLQLPIGGHIRGSSAFGPWEFIPTFQRWDGHTRIGVRIHCQVGNW